MNRTIKLLLAILLSNAATAQHDSLWNNFPSHYAHPFRTTLDSGFISADFSFNVNSSSATNDFLYRVYTRQDLNNEIIRNSADRSQLKNLVGAESKLEFEYAHLGAPFLKKDSLFWTLRYTLRNHVGVNYSDDLFRLVGLGNKAFEGDSAIGDGFEANQFRFDVMEFGIFKIFPDRSNLSIRFGPARGMRWLDAEGRRFRLHTAPYGTDITLDIDAEVHATPFAERPYAQVKGLGASLSAEYNRLLNPKGAVRLGFQNFGFITWDHTAYTKKDSIQYNGWNIPNWAELSRPGSGEQAFDSIEQVFSPTIDSTASQTAFLPTYVYLEYTMKLGLRTALSFKYDQVLFTPMLPRLTVGYTYFKRNFYGVTALSFGGYGRFNLNQELGYRLKRHQMALSLYGLEGWAIPKQASGLGAGMKYYFSF